MTIGEWIKKSQSKLAEAGIGTSRLDCLVLLEDEINKDRAWLLAHLDFEPSSIQVKNLEQKLKQRLKHFPLAYIRGKTEFYGREFKVSKDTLEPRPESETMIDLLKNIISPKQKLVLADIGTGSGALAITAKLELPNLEVVATEISALALKIAAQNAKIYKTDLKLYKGDLLKPVSKMPDILICNLPYVPDDFTINPAAMQEPKIAIFGGPDGLDLYRRLFTQIDKFITKPKYILTESLPPQHEKLSEIANNSGYKQAKEDDFIQLFTY